MQPKMVLPGMAKNRDKKVFLKESLKTIQETETSILIKFNLINSKRHSTFNECFSNFFAKFFVVITYKTF